MVGINWPKQRAWGWYATLIRTPWFCIKLLRFKPRGSLSMQRHCHRTERWLFLTDAGMCSLWWGKDIEKLSSGGCGRLRSLLIPPMTWHKFEAWRYPVYVLELQHGKKVTESDIERK